MTPLGEVTVMSRLMAPGAARVSSDCKSGIIAALAPRPLRRALRVSLPVIAFLRLRGHGSGSFATGPNLWQARAPNRFQFATRRQRPAERPRPLVLRSC